MQPANFLKIETLSAGWRDKDCVMLHACFQLLTDFVEKEMLVNNYPDWNAYEDTRQAKKEIEELYKWWQETGKKNSAKRTASFAEDHAIYEKENEMLKWLIDIRMHLWT